MMNRFSLTSARIFAPADFRRWAVGGSLLLFLGYALVAAVAISKFGIRNVEPFRTVPMLVAALVCGVALLVTLKVSETAGLVLGLLVAWTEVHFGYLHLAVFPTMAMLVPPLLIIGVGMLLGARPALAMMLATLLLGNAALISSPGLRATGLTSYVAYALTLYSVVLFAGWALVALSLAGFGRVFNEMLSRERDLADTIRFAPDGILVVNEDHLVLLANPAAEQLLDLPVGQIVGRRIADVLAASARGALVPEALPRDTGEGATAMELRRDDGSLVHVEATWRRMEGARRQLLLHDVSEQRRAEAERRTMELQLAQVQRLEAVGQLAGGLSHDFNNILTAVGGSAELLRGETDLVEQNLLIDEILSARDRGAALTRQLLSFARREVVQPRVLDLSVQVHAMRRMLQRVGGEQLGLELQLEPGCRVRVDIGQIEQALVNLVSNARDAMPAGGTCTVATSRVADDSGATVVRLSVSDTGMGMTPDVLARAFEPFFTTKTRGRGTGLGLASVHAVAANGRGTSRIESAPGQGTRVTIDFPFVDEPLDGVAVTPAVPLATQQTRTILVAEDDAGARATVERMLRLSGYNVLVAADGLAAFAIIESPPVSIDLLLTDVMMPGLTGPALAERVRAVHPDMPVLFMSGYAEEAVSDLGDWRSDRDFITKPFARQLLISRVAELLLASTQHTDSVGA